MIFLSRIIDRLFNYRPHFLLPVYFAVLIALTVYLSIFHFDPLESQRLYYDAAHEQYSSGADFNNFYFAAKRLMAGENFYFIKNPAQIFPGELPGGSLRFVYPPLLAYFFVPFSFFNLNTAFYLYTFFSVCLLLFSIYLFSRLFPERKPFFYAAVALLLFSPIVWFHLERGQTDIVVLSLISGACAFLIKNHLKSAGLLIGLAALFKFTPLIFIPYLFLKNKKAFWSSIATLVVGSLIFGVGWLKYFFLALKSFAGGFISSSIFSNSLAGVFYNRLTRLYLPFEATHKIYFILVLILITVVFVLLYRRLQANNQSSPEYVLPEFALLSVGLILLPNISWLYNGVHLLVLLAAWWCLRRQNSLSRIQSVTGDILIYLILAQPLLLPFFQTVPGSLLFALRPVYVIILLIIIFYNAKNTQYSRTS